MWNNYFLQIKKKYNMRVSTKKPLVINLDGKNITKNNEFNILELYKGGFRETIEQCAMYFTKRYNCISMCGADEISFIIENPMLLINDINSDNNNASTEIICVFVQLFSDYFNRFYNGERIYWHGKCYSINPEKINSFIKYKSRLIEVLTTTYFLKREGIHDAGNISLKEKIKKCNEVERYKGIKDIQKGVIYKNGERVDTEEMLKGNEIKIQPSNIQGQKNNIHYDDIEIEI